MTNLVSPLIEGDEVVLFVLVSFVLGVGVVIGRGWIQPAGGGGFLSFWRGFSIMVAWSVLTATTLAIVGPTIGTLMIEFVYWIPAVNLLVFGFASWSMARQAGMINRARAGIIALFTSGLVAFLIPTYLALR